MSDIFISYSREDRPRAKRIAEELERRGWSVWWDRMIPAGQVFDDVIEQAIHDAKCIIVLWSSHSVGSRWVRSEASEGADRQILVPVLIEEVPIPLAFKRIQAADLTTWRDGALPPSFEKLVADINALPGLARPGEGVQPQQADEDSSVQDAEVAVSEEQRVRESPGTGEKRTLAEDHGPSDEQRDREQSVRQVRAKKAGGFWYGIVTALFLVIIAGVGFWLYTSQHAPQTPVQVKPAPLKPEITTPQSEKPKVQSPILFNTDLLKTFSKFEVKTSPAEPGSTGPETATPESSPPQQAPPESPPSSAVLSPFESALAKYRDRETTPRTLSLKTVTNAANGATVPVSLNPALGYGRHAWLISRRGCWFVELYNASRAEISDFSIRVKMHEIDELVGLVESGGGQVSEEKKLVKVEKGSGMPCSRFSSPRSVGKATMSRLDRSVDSLSKLDSGVKITARARGDTVKLQLRFTHPMEASQYIQAIGIYVNNKPVAYVGLGPLVSKNPYLSLSVDGVNGKGRDLRIAWMDNKGKTAVSGTVSIK